MYMAESKQVCLLLQVAKSDFGSNLLESGSLQHLPALPLSVRFVPEIGMRADEHMLSLGFREANSFFGAVYSCVAA